MLIEIPDLAQQMRPLFHVLPPAPIFPRPRGAVAFIHKHTILSPTSRLPEDALCGVAVSDMEHRLAHEMKLHPPG